jgi:peptidyl-tRNA hydrolase, PTH1 family
VVVGLGNPGERYAGTRHNVGFMVVDALARQLGVSFKKKLFHSYSVGKATHGQGTLYLVKPLTFMNDSGRAVRDALRDSGSAVSELVVVCDTLDLSPGSLRFKAKGSSAGQKGLQSIIKALGTEEIMRLFVGIGRPDYKGQVVAHVLSTPRRAEEEQIADAVENACRAVLMLALDGPAKVMNLFNRKEPPE